jgi:hypothetical protein
VIQHCRVLKQRCSFTGDYLVAVSPLVRRWFVLCWVWESDFVSFGRAVVRSSYLLRKAFTAQFLN